MCLLELFSSIKARVFLFLWFTFYWKVCIVCWWCSRCVSTSVKRSPGRQNPTSSKMCLWKGLNVLMFIQIFNKNLSVLCCLFLCPSTFSIIRLEKHYRNEIQFLTPQSPFLCIIVKISFTYHARESKMPLLKRTLPPPLPETSAWIMDVSFFYNWIMSYAVIWSTPCVTTVVHECIKEYLPSIHYEMENPVCNTGSWGLALQCCPLSGVGLKSVKWLLDIAEPK